MNHRTCNIFFMPHTNTRSCTRVSYLKMHKLCICTRNYRTILAVALSHIGTRYTRYYVYYMCDASKDKEIYNAFQIRVHCKTHRNLLSLQLSYCLKLLGVDNGNACSYMYNVYLALCTTAYHCCSSSIIDYYGKWKSCRLPQIAIT